MIGGDLSWLGYGEVEVAELRRVGVI